MVTYNLAKRLASILAPLKGSCPHHIQNSINFSNKVLKYETSPRMKVWHFDVQSLYACIPSTEAVEKVMKWLLQAFSEHINSADNRPTKHTGTADEGQNNKLNNIAVWYVVGVSEKFGRIFSKHDGALQTKQHT